MRTRIVFWCASCLSLLLVLAARAAVVISEIHYHPVEEPAFRADGSPVLDLYDDVHEFVELHNTGAVPIALAGWKLSGGVDYSFPSNAVILAGEYLVVAKDKTRLAAVPAYALSEGRLHGPYPGQLSNNGEAIRLENARGDLVDSVSYSDGFPWAISADALGAGPDFTGIDPLLYQYRGRSLERVSFTHAANDPANWLASPLPGNPTPGRANTIQRSVPRPIVIRFGVRQAADEAILIRSNQPVRLEAVFSATNDLSEVRVEWFIDNINATNETQTTDPMSAEGPARNATFAATIPGQPDRSVVRFRFRADRGAGDEVISPRPDDPFEWHAYFVSPVRNSSRPVYDVFISSSSLSRLSANISQNPRRVTSPDPPGTPRASWNATEPAIFVHDGIVYEMRMRHHGSRYNRSAGRNSLKFQFPRYRLFNGYQGVFETDKGADFVAGHGIFEAAGLPTSRVRYVELYLNNSFYTRLEQEEMDDRLAERYHQDQAAANPGVPVEFPGEFYKSTGTIEALNPDGEGPYGVGDGRRLNPRSIWTPLERYRWTYGLQSAEWKGALAFKQMIDGLWAARGDTHTAPNPNVASLRSYLEQTFDVDATLTYLAVINWMGPWDETTQNHFLWQRRNGRWGMLPWDFDAMFGSGDSAPASASIYMGERGDPNNNFRGPNWIKDSFFKAFREEYKQKLFLLNNTLLHPDNLTALGFGSVRNYANQRFVAVNQQCGFGLFARPAKPVNLGPPPGTAAIPPLAFQSSPYAHSASQAPAHRSSTWIIRAANGSYNRPVVKITSLTNLTSLPVPFASLEFGQTYFWQVSYLDANGHSSLTSDETPFTFGPAPSTQSLLAIDAATTWKYNQNFTASPPTNWNQPGYDDAAWASGAPLFAVENAPLPESIRTPLTLGRTTYYFRRKFDLPADPAGATLRLSHLVDDGLVLYLNGVEVYRIGISANPVDYGSLADRTVADAGYEGTFSIPAANLVPGENLLAAEVHQSNAGSSDIVFGLRLETTIPAGRGSLVLNEIAAANSDSVLNSGTTPDWIELFNDSSQAVDLAGMSLSDDVLVPRKYVFPPQTLIPARGRLVVWCDAESDAPGLHAGFRLNDRGQTVVLFDSIAAGSAVRDFVTFGLQIPDRTLGRVADGSGAWTLTLPTPAAPNQPAPTAPPGNLKINEWLASSAAGDDWFELYNPDALPVVLAGLYLTDDLAEPSNTRVAPLSYIAARGFVRFHADNNPQNGPDHVGFRLSAGGDAIGLFAANGITAIDSVVFGAQTAEISEGRLPDGSGTMVAFAATPSPGESNHLPLQELVINEVLTHTDPPFEDAIEIYNASPQPIDIGGWFLSDELGALKKFRIPDRTILPALGYHVFYEYQFNADTNSPSSFSLSSLHGDDVYLSQADGQGNLTGYRTHVDFGPAASGISFGRYVTSVGVDFTALSRRTFGRDNPEGLAEFRQGTGALNGPAQTGLVIINEIMFHPPDIGTNDNTRDEYIELLNRTGAPLPLFDPMHPSHTWRLRDAVDFVFPTNLTLAAEETILVVSFDPLTNTTALAQFRNAYGLNPALRIFGPYEGKLANNSDQIELLAPGAPAIDPPVVPYLLVEKVRYADTYPWPLEADGTGNSLQRTSETAYANDPGHWIARDKSPGRRNGPPANVDTDGDGMPDAWEQAHGLNPAIPDADQDADQDRHTNIQEYFAGTHPHDATDVLRAEIVDGANGLVLRFRSIAGRAYTVEWLDDLTTGAWQKLADAPSNGGPSVEIPIPHGTVGARYYRVRTALPP